MLIIILYQQFLICGIIYLYNFYTFYIIVHSLPFFRPARYLCQYFSSAYSVIRFM